MEEGAEREGLVYVVVRGNVNTPEPTPKKKKYRPKLPDQFPGMVSLFNTNFREFCKFSLSRAALGM